ncbi:MAG TPA: replicative DNA helicase [Myxococcota bacterium]|nr:replicative DNA helicase [Myxococcota bacterium]HQK49996.1 replicative DNA helicase [Myxococcota bacterium]
METRPPRKSRPTGRRVGPGEVPLPHSPEAEEALLGTILLDAASMAAALEHLRAEDFFVERHQRVFQAMIRLFESQRGIDVVTVSDALRTQGDLELVGGPAFLSHLVREATSPSGLEAQARIIRDRALVRRMIEAAGTIVSEGYGAEIEPEEYLDRSEKRVLAIRDEQLRRSVVTLAEAVDRSMEKVRQQYEHRSPITGITTGYAELNKMLGGFQRSDLVIIAARPSMGKTAFALNLAINAAVGARGYGEPATVLFCSLEMNESQITDRMLAIRSGVDALRLRTGQLAESEMRLLEATRAQLATFPIFLDDSPRISVLELRAKARRLQWKSGLDLVMVDYLQLMEPSDKRVSREQQISEISRSLKAMAKELGIPVVALSQLSRAPDQRPGKDKRPILSDLRESGAIEQDADVVMFLYRPEYYDKKETKEEDKGILEVIVAKQRNGPTGTARLVMRRETMTVAEVASYGEPQ